MSNHGILAFTLLALCNASNSEQIPQDNSQRKRDLFSVLLSIQGELIGKIDRETNIGTIIPPIHISSLIEQRLCRNWGCDIGRLYAITAVPDIESRLKRTLSHASVDDFFVNGFGLSKDEYCIAANVAFGAIFQNVSFDRIGDAPPQIASIILRIMELVHASPEEVTRKAGGISDYRELASKAGLLLSTPAIKLKGRYFIPSIDALFNRLIRDVPHLCWKSRQREFSDSSRWFGAIFEGYAVWLFKTLFNKTEAEVISPYYIGGSEKDILLKNGTAAIAIEVKSTVPQEGERLIGEWEPLVRTLEKGSQQVFDAAEGLLAGKATYANKTSISKVDFVIPLYVTFDPFPFRSPFSVEFERRMENNLKRAIFNTHRTGIAPVQYLVSCSRNAFT